MNERAHGVLGSSYARVNIARWPDPSRADGKYADAAWVPTCVDHTFTPEEREVLTMPYDVRDHEIDHVQQFSFE